MEKYTYIKWPPKSFMMSRLCFLFFVAPFLCFLLFVYWNTTCFWCLHQKVDSRNRALRAPGMILSTEERAISFSPHRLVGQITFRVGQIGLVLPPNGVPFWVWLPPSMFFVKTFWMSVLTHCRATTASYCGLLNIIMNYKPFIPHLLYQN